MRRRPIVFAVLVSFLPACTVWQVQQGITPQQLIAARQPGKIRVTLPDSSQIVLHEPTIAGDSVAGVVHGRDSSVAASDVKQLAIRKVSGGRTFGAVVGLGLLGAVIVAGVALSNMCILSC